MATLPPVAVRCAMFFGMEAICPLRFAKLKGVPLAVPLPPSTRASTTTVWPRRLPLRWVGSSANSFARSWAVTRFAATGSVDSLPETSMTVPGSMRIFACASPPAAPSVGLAAAVIVTSPPGTAMLPPRRKTRSPSRVTSETSWVWASTAVPVAASSGRMLIELDGATASSPPCEEATTTAFDAFLSKTAVSAASSRIEPLAATVVVADNRPSWLTARPTIVILPRGALTWPVSWFQASPPLSTSTTRPRRAGSELAWR